MAANQDIVFVQIPVLRAFMKDVLLTLGVCAADAETVSEVLSEADARGIPSHGVARFKGFYADPIRQGIINPKAIPTIVRDVQATAVVDGNFGLGHPIGRFAMDLAIKKAKKFGLGFVTVRNSNHYGIAGWYASRALANNMIGITGTNARPSVAPTNSVEPMFGTNPIAFAMPVDDEFPFVFDAATTIAQRGKVETYARLGKTLPDGWVIGEDGQCKTEPASILSELTKGKAALLPIGGIFEETGSHKGFGFATIVEILSSVLQQGAFLQQLSGMQNGKRVPNCIGHFFAAVNMECFGDVEEMKKHAGELLKTLRAAKRRTPEQEIFTAGIKELRTAQRSEHQGVPVDSEVIAEILSLKKDFSLSQYQFPFE